MDKIRKIEFKKYGLKIWYDTSYSCYRDFTWLELLILFIFFLITIFISYAIFLYEMNHSI